MLIHSTASQVPCRTVVVPSCERDFDTSQGSVVEALALFQIRIRDTIDFTVDFSEWLRANGNAQLSAATFAVAAQSPQQPEIVEQVFSPLGKCVVVLAVGDGAVVGNAYHIDVTVTVAAVAATPGEVAIPARTLVRRIHVVVVNG